MAVAAVEVLNALGGAGTLQQILGHTTRRALRTALARGDVERLSSGVYALPSTSTAIKRAAALHGVLSHESAAAHWLMAGARAPSSIHVTVPRNAHRLRWKGVTLHYADLDDERVTSPLRTVIDCARAMPFTEALAIADSACRLDFLTTDDLTAAAERLRGAGAARVRRVLSNADPRAANPFESVMRGIVMEAGITGFLPQLEIVLGPRRVRVDLGDPQRKIVFEADSHEYHSSPQALERDCERYDDLLNHGWLVQRFGYHHVMDDQEWTRRTMLIACGLRITPAGSAGRSR